MRSILHQSIGPDRRVWTHAIVERGSDAFIGTCEIAIIWHEYEAASIGFRLKRDRWGRGYMTEACHELLRFGFEDLRLRRISASCSTKNTASVRVMQKIGMQLEGIARQERMVQGSWHDTYQYAILKGDARPP